MIPIQSDIKSDSNQIPILLQLDSNAIGFQNDSNMITNAVGNMGISLVALWRPTSPGSTSTLAPWHPVM